MSIIISQLGEDDGDGHEIRVLHQDDGIVVLLSRNPDTEEVQRIVLMESQWRGLLRVLLEIHGRDKCCYFRIDGTCAPQARPD